MREKISVYVDELFSDAALTIRNAEVQQEILQHTLDRYDDLIAAGKTPDAGTRPFRTKNFRSRKFSLDKFIIFDIMIKLYYDSKVNTYRSLEQLWRSRLVGRGRMIGNHVGS